MYGFAAAPPHYVPVDEDHPARPANCYALAKMANESAADYFVARYGMTILSFRFMGVRSRVGSPPRSNRWQPIPPRAPGCCGHAPTPAMPPSRRLALETESVPSGPYNITGAEIALPAAALDLVRTHLGAVTEIRSPLPGHASPMSCLRAQQAFGYAPRYIWRLGQSHPEEDTR